MCWDYWCNYESAIYIINLGGLVVLRDNVQLRKKLFYMYIARSAQTPSTPSLKRAKWSFFRPAKTTFWRVLRNQVQIDYDNENDDYYDDNGDNLYDYGDGNYQKPDKYPDCQNILLLGTITW